MLETLASVTFGLFRWIWRRLFPPKPQRVIIATSPTNPLHIAIVAAPVHSVRVEELTVPRKTPETSQRIVRAEFDGWRLLSVGRRTSGLQREVTGSIRTRVIAALQSAGTKGATTRDLIECWGGTGTVHSVADCLNILFGDSYGYIIERRLDPATPSLYQYRLRPGSPTRR